MSFPVSDGHVELGEIEFWANDEARYSYLINYVEDGEERALLHDSETEQVVFGIRQKGTGIYCEIERRDVQNERKFIYDSV